MQKKMYGMLSPAAIGKLLVLIIFMMSPLSFAANEFVITDIQVKGLQKLDEGTVFNYLPLKVGDEVDDQEVSLGIKALYKTGFFENVSFEKNGTVLVVIVIERPSISSVNVTGNSAIKDEQLKFGFDKANLIEGRILNRALLSQVEQEIKNTYLSIGRYSTTIDTQVEDIGNNQVNVNLTIDEGRVAKIKVINIIGIHNFKVKEILSRFKLNPKKGINIFNKRDQYSKQKLEADLEMLQNFYLDRGYHDFKITSSSVDISPNKQFIFISVSIVEGVQYTFGDIQIEGTATIPHDQLKKMVTVEKGQPFSRKVVNQTKSLLTAKYTDKGYAFAEVTPVLQPDQKTQVVDIIFTIKQNNRVYIRTIGIRGNSSTHDAVIRRELRIYEGGWYSATAIKRSKERLQRLGFFKIVNIETIPVVGKQDQVNLDVVVKESNTGRIEFSLGYSDADGILTGIQYRQRNLFGTGKKIVADISRTNESSGVVLKYTNPYINDAGVSRSFTLTQRKLDAEKANTAAYILDTLAFGMNYKIPISETNSFNIGVEVERLDLTATKETPPEFRFIINKTPTADDLVLNVGVSKDATDDFFFPTRGAKGAVTLEAAVPGSDFEYYKLNLSGMLYLPLGNILTLKSRAMLGYGGAYDDKVNEGLPFFKNYFVGGSRTVRGYGSRSLGPRDTGRTPEPTGGNKRIVAGLELLAPPFGRDDNRDKRFGLFLDTGMVYAHNQDFDLKELKHSAGIVFNWVSPVGPFSISYGLPLNKNPSDDVDKFQLTLGTLF